MFANENEIDQTFEMLLGDLETLFRLTFSYGSSVTTADTRAASVILRKWISDGLLGRLLNATNSIAKFRTLDSKSAINNLTKRGDVTFYVALGVRLHQPLMHLFFSNEQYEPEKHHTDLKDDYVYLSYGEFKNKKRLLFEGKTFSTDSIIDYMANKLGGAHLDFKNHDRFGKLNLASKFAMFGPPERSNEFENQNETQIYLVQLPEGSDVFSVLNLEIIAASASFIQMEYNGSPLFDVKVNKTFTSKLKGLFKLKENGRKIHNIDKHGFPSTISLNSKHT